MGDDRGGEPRFNGHGGCRTAHLPQPGNGAGGGGAAPFHPPRRPNPLPPRIGRRECSDYASSRLDQLVGGTVYQSYNGCQPPGFTVRVSAIIRAVEAADNQRRPGANGRHRPPSRGGVSRVSARREREREIVDATRALFDERGVQDAPMEEIARAVGINKALIYRHFASQEELFVLTVSRYLGELAERFAQVDESLDPQTQLRHVSESFVSFCSEYPAFLDCAMSLMRQPYEELVERVSEGVLFRLGQSMSGCVSRLSRILKAGVEQEVFRVEDPDLMANMLYAQGIGAMHLARVGAGVREVTPGVPQMFTIDSADVARTAVNATFAYVLAPGVAGAGGARG